VARKPPQKLYIEQLMDAMQNLFPPGLLGSIGVHGNAIWTPMRLLVAAVLMGWDDAQTLSARFQNVRELLRRWFPGWVTVHTPVSSDGAGLWAKWAWTA
jgi:hypothetical protein